MAPACISIGPVTLRNQIEHVTQGHFSMLIEYNSFGSSSCRYYGLNIGGVECQVSAVYS